MTISPITTPPPRVSSLAASILADLPEYVELQACRDRHLAATSALRSHAAETNLVDLDTAVRARLGEPDAPTGADLVDLATQVLGRREAFTLAMASLQAAGQRLDNELNVLIEESGDFILERMDAQLQELIDRARSLQPLAVAADPAHAIRVGRGEDYEKLLAIGKAYRDLRTEQFRILQRDLEHGTSAPIAAIKDMEDAFPHYDVWNGLPGVLREHGSRATRPVTPPWPTADGQRFNIAVAEPRFLFWAVEKDVHLWIPTRDQHDREADRLDSHFEGLRRRARAPRPGEWTDSRGRLVVGFQDSPADVTGLVNVVR